jgi:cytidine deaminase
MTTAADLLAHAENAAARAYCPYSKFPVGAATLWDDGSIYTGVNVENAASPLAVCAERNAIATAVGRGSRRLVMVAVWADVEDVVTPCGGCRQVMLEFAPEDLAQLQVVMGGRGSMRTRTLVELLPDSFRSY